jgi:myo-inositol-1-phosphate synthase
MSDRTGVWIVGAGGDVAVSAMVGARAVARAVAGPTGLVTALPDMKGLDLVDLGDLVFGGCDLHEASIADRAWSVHREHGVIAAPMIEAVVPDLKTIDAHVDTRAAIAPRRPGGPSRRRRMRSDIRRVTDALDRFRRGADVDRVVVVNLASTEPPVPDSPAHHTLEAFERALDGDLEEAVSPSVLYAYAAMQAGCAFVNFTPSRGPRVAALNELAHSRGVPYCGSDGKTGETLVKTALAPMFVYRNLRVLTWFGYNMLGNNDGRVLADPAARESKLASKGGVLPSILGYAPDAKVTIDYVPSLTDWKTAWDFIHFEGFLGTRMSMQFTWQGCDSLLAAPLVLDLVRLSDLALRRGECGPLLHTACFFKDPIGVAEQNLSAQFQLLLDYATR